MSGEGRYCCEFYSVSTVPRCVASVPGAWRPGSILVSAVTVRYPYYEVIVQLPLFGNPNNEQLRSRSSITLVA
jgi:hypothetical protein